jgi:DUF1680 family protein
MCRFADHMIKVFGHGPGQMRGYCGHEEVELALVRLARVTGKTSISISRSSSSTSAGPSRIISPRRPCAMAAIQPSSVQKTYEYGQAHLPVREQTKVVGHAVRAMYLYSGMADIATEYNDDTLTSALETLWDDLTTKQMYVTGGIGPAASNEGFHRLLRPAERKRLCRNLRLRRPGLLGQPHARPWPEPPLCRHHGAGTL